VKYYELRHVVGFEETNLLGNVYYVHHLQWQGRCREMFLRDHAPGILGEIAGGLRLATVRCSCEYDEDLHAFDELAIRMFLGAIGPSSLTLRFDYVRLDRDRETRIARGEQVIACVRGSGADTAAVAIPDELRAALRAYEGSAP
jgi:enediyne biosynthesis thioesterase